MKRKAIIMFLLILMVFSLSNCGNEKHYKETALKFEFYGICEGGPWDIFLDDNDDVYTYEWDMEIRGVDYIFLCRKMIWKNGILSYEDVNISDIKNSFGKLIPNEHGYVNLTNYYIKDGFIYFLIEEKDYISKEDYSIQQFNLETEEFVQGFELNGLQKAKFSDGSIYGYSENKIFQYDLSGNILRGINLPENEEEYKDESGNIYNKRSIFGKAGNIYYTNKNGVYFVGEGETELSLIMDSSDSIYLKSNYEIIDMVVDSEGKIYILSLDYNKTMGENPTDLAVYEIEK